ncbi:MAG: response regulator, partial [Treponema sp.]|nr:response regulator [Treponema sp.]
MYDEVQTVLIVDDIDTNVTILEEILKKDYIIISASNGREALEKLADANPLPRIILLDIQMPEMDGRKMFEYMKENEKLKRIPVIFITA